jgi:hypothetical protein
VFLFSIQLLSEKFLILRRNERDTIKKYILQPSCKINFYSCQILIKLEFSGQSIEKNIQISNMMKIRPVGAELFHADGQRDRHDEDNSRVSQFCESAYKLLPKFTFNSRAEQHAVLEEII